MKWMSVFEQPPESFNTSIFLMAGALSRCMGMSLKLGHNENIEIGKNRDHGLWVGDNLEDLKAENQ